MRERYKELLGWMWKHVEEYDDPLLLAEACQEVLGKSGSAKSFASTVLKVNRRIEGLLSDLSRSEFPSTYQHKWGGEGKVSESWRPVYVALRCLSEEAEACNLAVHLTDQYDQGVGETMTIKVGGKYKKEPLAGCSISDPAMYKKEQSDVTPLVTEELRRMALEAIQAIYRQSGEDFHNYYNEPALHAVASAAGVIYSRFEL